MTLDKEGVFDVFKKIGYKPIEDQINGKVTSLLRCLEVLFNAIVCCLSRSNCTHALIIIMYALYLLFVVIRFCLLRGSLCRVTTLW